jgi:CheY-like chemotaxis protein
MSEKAEGSRPVILVVDDDPHLRELHDQLLTAAGYGVLLASSGPEALAAAQEEDVNLVLLDLAMPGMDGIEAMARLMDINRQLPVIIYTAYSTYRDDFQTWTAEAYVTKESSRAELLKAIRQALEKRGVAIPDDAREMEKEEAEEEGV